MNPTKNEVLDTIQLIELLLKKYEEIYNKKSGQINEKLKKICKK